MKSIAVAIVHVRPLQSGSAHRAAHFLRCHSLQRLDQRDIIAFQKNAPCIAIGVLPVSFTSWKANVLAHHSPNSIRSFFLTFTSDASLTTTFMNSSKPC